MLIYLDLLNQVLASKKPFAKGPKTMPTHRNSFALLINSCGVKSIHDTWFVVVYFDRDFQLSK